MKHTTLSTLCILLASSGLLAVSGCDREDASANESATAESPTESQGAALRESDESDDETEVVEERNYSPEILNLEFNPSKFVQCGEQLEICVEARDRNGDTLEFTWKQLAGDQPRQEMSISEATQTGSDAKECVTFKPDRGFNQLKVVASEQGSSAGKFDSISFPLHVGKGNCEK